MPELTDLQEILLQVIKNNCDKGLFSNTCKLKSHELITKMRIKPNHENYISRLLAALEKKGKIIVTRKQTEEGLTRIITLL